MTHERISWLMGLPPALDIDLLRSFVLIAEGGSFTRAAERVGRTQSAVSLQIKRLESLLGQRLFARGNGGAPRLTSHGFDLLERARELISLNDDIVSPRRTTPKRGEDDVATKESLPTEPNLPSASRTKTSLAVLPFQNLSGDPAQNYFAEGMADSVVAGLSRVKSLLVIARHSTSGYRARPEDARRSGRALGVRYVLEGGVFKAGFCIRVTARLTDVETGALLWADRYRAPLEDLFELEDQIADRVVGILEPMLRRSEIERARRKPLEKLDAYDLYLRAAPLVAAQMPRDAKKALALLERVLKLDPDYTPAHALAAWCHELCFTRDGFDKTRSSAALHHARLAMSANSDDANTLAVAGFVAPFCGAPREAGLATVDRASAMNPSCATALYLGAQAHALAGHSLEAAALAGRALWLSPFDPLGFEAHLALGESALQEERFDDAAACFGRVTICNPNFSTGYMFQGLALAAGGRVKEAQTFARRGLELESSFAARFVYECDLAPSVAEKFLAGARALGLPE
ncbi:MAG TPA: LysR family transcriptional regulator [Roseiarcus sp.]|nr:LysR family transcriptional regulator [Roseiarcus sp.]